MVATVVGLMNVSDGYFEMVELLQNLHTPITAETPEDVASVRLRYVIVINSFRYQYSVNI